MFTEDLFELFSEYESLPEAQKPAFLTELKAQYPDKAEQLKLLTQDNHNFTEHFLENISSYSESMAIQSINEGDDFGVYTIVKPIGSGGMGQVYLAKRNDGLIEQQVAIKFLHPALYQLNSTQTLLNEAQALASLNHPNIATILDVVKMPDGLIYMVMEYIEGCTLTEYLAKNDLSIREKLNLFLTIADAVQEAHSQRIIHADIKASNILINHKNQPQLIDFGIMQFVGNKEEKANTFINQYLCAMTVNYAAPEQLQGQQASIQSDVYALGGLLYFILSGQTPFEEISGTLSDKIKLIAEQEIPACKTSQKLKFKQDIDWILSTCLAKQPEQRFRSVGALISELNNYLNNQPLKQSSTGFYRLSKSWQRHKITYSFTVILILLLGAFFSKTWYDNIKIQQSYRELANSYLNQYTSLQEVTSKADEMNLPLFDSVPIDLYIQLAFQKFEHEWFSNFNDNSSSRKVIKELKNILLTAGMIDAKTSKLIRFREFLVKTQPDDNYNYEKELLEYKIIYKSLIEQDDLNQQEIVDILILAANNEFREGSNEYHKLMIQKLAPLKDSFSSSPILKFKYYMIISQSEIGGIKEDKATFPISIEEFLSFAKKHSNIIPAYLYKDALLYSYGVLMDSTGYTKDYHFFIKEAERYMSHIDIDNDDDKVGQVIWAKIESANLFQSLSKYIYNSNGAVDPIEHLDNEAVYFQLTGNFSQASKVLNKRKKFFQKENSEIVELHITSEDSYLTALNLQQGIIVESLNLINDKLIPDYDKHFSDDYKATYLSKFCIPLSYHLNIEELESYCKAPYFLTKPILGETNFWTDYSLNQLVWWYALHPHTEEEYKYVERIENIVPSSLNYFKIQQLESLIFYFINRNNTEKASHYTEILEQTITDYAGDIYVVHRDTATLYKAEIALLNQDNKKAEELLSSAANKVCTYQPKNYLRMHLNQVSNKAGLGDMCLN